MRADEHLDIKSKYKSAVSSHIVGCDVCMHCLKSATMSYRGFVVIKSGQYKSEVEILEALLIKKYNPSMNQQLFSSGCSATLKIFD